MPFTSRRCYYILQLDDEKRLSYVSFPSLNIGRWQVSLRIILPKSDLVKRFSTIRTYFVNLIHVLPSDPWQFVRIVYFGDPRCPILSSISSGNDIVRGPARNSTWTRADISDNEGDIFQDRDARIEKMRAGVTGGEKRQPEERMKRRERNERSVEGNERRIKCGETKKRRGIVSSRFFRAKRRRRLSLLRTSCNRKWERCGGSGKPRYAGRFW